MINAILRDGRFAVCLFACCLVSVAFGKVFDPRDFGAVGNGTNFRTLPGAAFVRARWIDPD